MFTSRWTSHVDPLGTTSTVPVQWWVPSVRTDVVWMATLAPLLDWLVVRAEVNVIDFVPDCWATKLR